MNNKNEQILIDLYLSSEEAQELQVDSEIQASVKKGMTFLAKYKKKAMAEKAANFRKSLGEEQSGITHSKEQIRKLFEQLMNGDFGIELRERGLGYNRNLSKEKLSDEEKRVILQELDLLRSDDE